MYKHKGFLLIELMVAIGLLCTLSVLLGKYYTNILMYRQETILLNEAVNIASSHLEAFMSQDEVQQEDSFIVVKKVVNTKLESFVFGIVQVDWQSGFKKNNSIKMVSGYVQK